MIVTRTFHHSSSFPQGYSKSGMIKEALYLILSLEVNVGQSNIYTFKLLTYVLC